MLMHVIMTLLLNMRMDLVNTLNLDLIVVRKVKGVLMIMGTFIL